MRAGRSAIRAKSDGSFVSAKDPQSSRYLSENLCSSDKNVILPFSVALVGVDTHSTGAYACCYNGARPAGQTPGSVNRISNWALSTDTVSVKSGLHSRCKYQGRHRLQLAIAHPFSSIGGTGIIWNCEHSKKSISPTQNGSGNKITNSARTFGKNTGGRVVVMVRCTGQFTDLAISPQPTPSPSRSGHWPGHPPPPALPVGGGVFAARRPRRPGALAAAEVGRGGWIAKASGSRRREGTRSARSAKTTKRDTGRGSNAPARAR